MHKETHLSLSVLKFAISIKWALAPKTLWYNQFLVYKEPPDFLGLAQKINVATPVTISNQN